MRWIRRLTLTLALALALAALGFTQASPGEQSGSSAQLYVFSGSVTVAGEQAPEGFIIVAKVGDYTSEPVTVRGGQYHQLKVLPGAAYNGQLISFWSGNVQADEFGGRYVQRGVFGVPALVTLDLTFNAVPGNFNPFPTAIPTSSIGQPQPTAGVQGNVPVGGVNLPDVGGASPSPLWVVVLVLVGVGAVGTGVAAMRLTKPNQGAPFQTFPQALLDGGEGARRPPLPAPSPTCKPAPE